MSPARRRIGTTLLGLTFIALVAVVSVPRAGSAVVGGPGGSGIDTSLPEEDSALTVNGRGDFASLSLRVNQTRNLTNQAVSVTWTGGVPTQRPGRFEQNYLQIMQCWGDDDGTNPDNPGPLPEQCVSGATTGAYGVGGVVHPPSSEAISRIVSFGAWPNASTTTGWRDPATGFIWRPFHSVDGTVVNAQYDTNFNPELGGGNYWQNPYFDITTTNEIAGAITRPNGTGSDLVEINTGVESSGLGCGQRLQRADGTFFTPKCWLVIVPRGSAEKENAGTPYELDAAKFGVMTSPLADNAWKNRIAVPLDFNSVDPACSLGTQERRLVGTELVAAAVSSWQPALCSTAGRPPYSYASLGDGTARQQILSPSVGAPGMAVVSRAAVQEQVDTKSPPVYAPLALSGVVIGFNVDRIPQPTAEPAAQDLAGVKVANLNLTPRLVAKLLTQSYRSQVNIASVTAPYAWSKTNPIDMNRDPDFTKFNPEFDILQMPNSRNFSGLLAPGGNSDAAKQVWEWVLADPEAKAWLDGAADEWGMTVNPVYATTAAANSNGARFDDPVPSSFPKADPNCLQEAAQSTYTPPPLCSTDWMPYTQSYRDGARMTRAADDRAKITRNPFAFSADTFWIRSGPQILGRRGMLTVTDTVSAAKYGIQTASLSRAGDDGDARSFVAPTAEALTKGIEGMKPVADPTVLQSDPTADVPAAYPLPTISYAMVRPLTLETAARDDYAAFIEYAVGAGQEPGLEPGLLPRGYAVLPDGLKAQATKAGTTIREMQPPPEEPAPAATPTGGGDTGSGTPSPSPTSARRPTATTAPSPPASEVAAVESVSDVKAPDAGPLTPILALARSRYFLAVLAAVAVVATLAALEITKRPRRTTGPLRVPPTDGGDA